jgi:decaprenylphospho-beta-D-erythro-pentofuranosid-2-ulose 2-reductase
MKKIAIIGATSAIATACARLWAMEQAEFFLVARNQEKLKQTRADLLARGAGDTHTYVLDLVKLEQYTAMLDTCTQTLGQIDLVLIAHGTLPEQSLCEQDANVALQEFTNNALSVIALLTSLANYMEQQRSGIIAVISSVAGDRGRASNYLYGSAKAAVSAFCEGLRVRMFKVGVHVLTIKPGFVATPMTRGLPLPGALVATPERVAKDIAQAIASKQNVLYTPWFWQPIMLVIRLLPQAIFKRLTL